MRPLKRFAAVLAVTIAASSVMATLAEAQQRRPLRITVQKRSFFDAGNIVPVGALNRYATQQFTASPVYASSAELYGEGTLPGRVGAGVNPFANSFATPRF